MVPRKTRVRRTVDDANPLVARPTGKTRQTLTLMPVDFLALDREEEVGVHEGKPLFAQTPLRAAAAAGQPSVRIRR
jgi:hypothetical protein